jgi:hypothetical protein
MHALLFARRKDRERKRLTSSSELLRCSELAAVLGGVLFSAKILWEMADVGPLLIHVVTPDTISHPMRFYPYAARLFRKNT